MIKYLGYAVTFQEVPNETTLCFNITNCKHRCPGCHSPELQKDIGDDLEKDIDSVIKKYIDGITCVCFMGEGNDWDALRRCMLLVSHNYPNIKIALYTGIDGDGCDEDTDELQSLSSMTTGRNPDGYDRCHEPLITYLKLGKYIKELGGLDNPHTNQRMLYQSYIDDFNCPAYEDITSMFWKDKTTNTQKGFHKHDNY